MNLRECAALFDGARFDEALSKMQQEMGRDMGKERLSIMIDEPRVEPIAQDRVAIVDGPRLRANVQTTVVTLEDHAIHRETSISWLDLRFDGNGWKLVPDAPNVPHGRPGQNILQEFVNFIASPIKARSTAREAGCQSNLRQLCLGMMQLAQDFDEKFDIKKMQEMQRANNQFAKWPIWVQAVLPYVKNLQLFHCPDDRNKGEGVTSYSFNENLQGVGLNNLARPSEIVMLYEGKDVKLEFRHDVRATVGFADGHVKLINEEQAKALIWQP
jgi:prepilin-type processing-associated H-X9-DG protein